MFFQRVTWLKHTPARLHKSGSMRVWGYWKLKPNWSRHGSLSQNLTLSHVSFRVFSGLIFLHMTFLLWAGKSMCILGRYARILCIAWTGLKIRLRLVFALARRRPSCFRILGIRLWGWATYSFFGLLCLLPSLISWCCLWSRLLLVELSLAPVFCSHIWRMQALLRCLRQLGILWTWDGNHILDKTPYSKHPIPLFTCWLDSWREKKRYKPFPSSHENYFRQMNCCCVKGY